MGINYEMERYTELTGEDGTKVPISRLCGYFDGYEKGRVDAIDKFLQSVIDGYNVIKWNGKTYIVDVKEQKNG